MLELDDFFEEVVEFGWYQAFVVFLLTVPGCFMNAYQELSFIFMILTPDHRCKLDSYDVIYRNDTALNHTHEIAGHTDVHTVGQQQCYTGNSSSNGCPYGWVYGPNKYTERSLVSEWDLVCDQSIHIRNMQAVLALASVVGCVFLAWFQDKYGRKTAFMLVLCLFLVGNLSSLLSQNIVVYTCLKFFSSLTNISLWNICFVWSLEYVGPNRRTLVSTIFCVVYAVAIIAVGVNSVLFRTWRMLGLATSLPFVACASYYFVIDESPRWLIQEGRTEEAKRTLQKMARWQRKEIPQALLDQLLAPSGVSEKQKAAPHVTVRDLFRGKALRMKTFLLTLCWFANVLVYQTINFNVENLGAELLLVFMVQGAVEAPSTLINLVILDRFGRIWPICIAMTIAGIASLATTPGVEYLPLWLIVILVIVSKCGITNSYANIYQLGGELYPTTARGIGVGFSSVIADLGMVVMPYILHSSQAYRMLPMAIVGVFAIVGGLSVLLLPETLHTTMPETLQDAETHGQVGVVAMKQNARRCCTGEIVMKAPRKPLVGDGVQQLTPLVGETGVANGGGNNEV